MRIVHYFLLISIALLSGCSTITLKDTDKTQTQETVHAFLMSEDTLYVIGDNHDYIFKGDALAALTTFSQSPFAKRIVTVSGTLAITNGTQVRGTYQIYLNPTFFSAQEQQTLRDHYGFRITERRSREEQQSIASNGQPLQQGTPMLTRYYAANGTVTQLKDRGTLLATYSLPKPIIVSTQFYKTQRDVSGDFAAVALFPVAVVAMVPMMIVWGTACAMSSDGC